ncbi:MAG: OmpA family protein [Mariprofundaceae bacterium]|nr:OmpA family protein [Mariprofundaceae bacterium]
MKQINIGLKFHYNACWLFSLFLFYLMATSQVAAASLDERIELLQQDIQGFMQSDDYDLAPSTIARAQAYLGAAMLSNQQDDEKETASRVRATEHALTEARRLVTAFLHQNKEVLQLRGACIELLGNAKHSEMEGARVDFNTAIRSIESGHLNESGQYIDAAKKAYKEVLTRHLPLLIEESGKAISAASSKGAKKYAPITYQAALEAKAALQHYLDNNQRNSFPKQPRRAIKLAETAKSLALQVKEWRKQPMSYEFLVLKAKHGRLNIARSLDMDVNVDDVLANVSTATLVREVKDLRKKREQDRTKYAQELSRLSKQHQETIHAELAKQRDLLRHNQEGHIQDLKSAFSAKLESETHEQKRQKHLKEMFSEDETSILIHADGSLLVRLKTLQFASGSARLSSDYFELLDKLKMALELYPERAVQIEGHTDNQGDLKANQGLSLQRAEAIRDYLLEEEIAVQELTAAGYGEVKPIASNDFSQGRVMNRRIDVIIQKEVVEENDVAPSLPEESSNTFLEENQAQ